MELGVSYHTLARCMVQHFLASRDSPLIPLRRSLDSDMDRFIAIKTRRAHCAECTADHVPMSVAHSMFELMLGYGLISFIMK